ncbi:hypothetical protein E4U43_007793 [Claviceps pusilla]|uniref:Protamine P1 n=1 Tax=Claviceps pusilla TaxID=123648 RepID=A0A9P7NED2_9HYPO|nr:hypothetical protein E4U43_007793 [Claviceps pusilla]
MAAANAMSVKVKSWTGGDDTIYSESCCEKRDIFYEGSEDEGYKRPADRRRRYEESGQRFLNGQIPSIMSAALEGPFDRPSGWINPWMSKRNKAIVRTTKDQARSQAYTSSRRSSTKIHRSQESTLAPPINECHLPSPESLKQAPQNQDHSFLGTEKLAVVKKWQEKISRPASNCDSFWNNETIDSSPPMRKRRASRSDWLKKDSVKRPRPDIQQRRRSRPSQDEDIDELMADMPPSSFDHYKSFSSPSRRQISRKVTRSFKTKKLAESDDELSPNKAAAATLSSPVSLQNASRRPFCSDTKTNSSDILSTVTAQSTPSHLRLVEMDLQSSGEVESQPCDCIDNDAMSCEAKDMAPETSELPMPDSSPCVSFRKEENTVPNGVMEPVEQASHENISQTSANDQEKIIISDTLKTNSNADITTAPLDSSSPDSTQKEAPSSSFRDILSRFVPSSPWKRLSHLTSGSPLSAVRSACQAPFSQQGILIVEPPVYAKSEEAGKPTIDEIADSSSNLANPIVHEEASNSDQSSEQTQISGSASVRDEQTGLETDESHTGAPSDGNVQEVGSQTRISASQQSPWAKSDEAIGSKEHLSAISPVSTQSDCVSQNKNVAQPQSPWVPHSQSCVQAGNFGNGKHIIAEDSATMRATWPRPRTPEPQFCFKPFASFMTPSPDRSQNKFSWRSISKAAVRDDWVSLPSIMKGGRGQRRVNHRVSWAVPLAEFHGSPLPSQATTMCTTNAPKRQRSPPPETPMADVSKYCDDKFSKHFEAIAKREDDGETSPVSTASAKSRPSTELLAMAESLSPAGAAVYDDDEVDLPQGKCVSRIEEAERPICERGSEEPLDMMEDMVREMGDFWDPWNVDLELEQARKNGSRLSVAGT